ncbi:MAG: 2-hydroxy-3-oxopropionate reductase [Cyanobacteria bacterium RYN_339]|nr:2-hydroxy-3-oxopropionate reductase [Cyanobacteria bacterium RYN_339]
MKIGFIGAGNMGQPIAGRLVQAGHDVTVYNRTRAHAELIAGAKVADTPAHAATDAEIVMTMLSDDVAVEAVVEGPDGFARAMPEGSLHICSSTISVALSARLAKLHLETGRNYIGAPVFGRPAMAAEGKLTIVAAGPDAQLDRAQPIFDAIGQRSFRFGNEPEKAHLIKLSGNFLLAATVESLAEAFALVRKAGISPEAYLDFLSDSLFASPATKTYGEMIAKGLFTQEAGFKLSLALKDCRLVLDAADNEGVPMPVASLVHDQMLGAIGRGYANLDFVGLARVAEENAGLEARGRA